MLHGHGTRAHAAHVATAPGAAADTDRIEPGTVVALVAMAFGIFLIANDFTALNVALPAIEEDFDVDVGTAQWVINAYCLVFGMAIVTGGRLADMFGRRRVFFIGATIFGVFSALGGLAPSASALIAMRVGMGVGGALMWPAILGMTYAALPASHAGLAGGLVLGIAGIGNATGPLIGGALTDALSWRWIFFLNVPVAALAIVITWMKVHQPRGRSEAERIDYAGIATLSLGLVLLLLALDQSADWGWGDPRVIGMLATSAALIVAFGFIEPRMGRNALIPMDVMRNREFSAAFFAVLMISAVFFTTVLYMPQFMEKILDYSAFKAGLGMLPMLGMFALMAFVAGPLYERVGAKLVVSAGAALLVAGPFLLSLVDADSGYGSLIAGLALTGTGVGLFYPSITTAGVTALDAARSSLAGGLVYMSQIAGGAIGLGISTTIFTSASENELAEKASAAGTNLSDHQVGVLHGVLAGTDAGEAALSQLGADVADRITAIVRESFVAGIQTTFEVVAAIAVAGFVISILFVGGRLFHRGSAAPDAP
jgi:EmrB/QacA subfamily drug resistance transporter